MLDIFSVVLNSAVSWGVGRLLDSALNCTRCGSRQEAEPDNSAYNDFGCHSCGHSLAEYVNATEHTTNRNKSVVAAKLYGTHWPKWRDTFKVYYNLDVVNSRYQEVVVELLLSEFRGAQFHRFESIRKPTSVGFQKVGTPGFQNLSPPRSAHRRAQLACLRSLDPV